MTELATIRRRNVAWVCFTALVFCVLIVYRETFIAMVGIWWRSETFTHAFLVPPIVVWMVWRERHNLNQLSIKPNPWFLFPILAFGFFWLLGDLVAVNAVTQFAVIGVLVLLVPFVFGLQVTRHLVFPLLFLFFCVPVGEFAMPKLMEWTADFTVQALRITGVPVYREGLQFVIPSGTWSVVEACSGVRYLIASLTVGTLFAYLNYKSATRRTMFIVVSALVPILANWLRAYMIVMLGHLSGNKLAAGVDHLIYGWVFFGIVILLMFLIGAKWADMPVGTATLTASVSRTEKALQLLTPRGNYMAVVAVLLFSLFVVVAPWGVRIKIDSMKSQRLVQLDAPRILADGWQLTDVKAAEWVPAFENPSAEVNTAYQKAGEQVGLYIGYYRNQDYRRKLVSSQNVLVRSKDGLWAQVSSGAASLDFAGQQQLARSAHLRGSSLADVGKTSGLAVRQIYWVNGKLTSSDMGAKLQGALMQLMGKGDDSAVIILYAKAESDSARNPTLESFARSNGASILAILEAVAAQGKMPALPPKAD